MWLHFTIYISRHHVVHFKYIQILFANYTSIRLENIRALQLYKAKAIVKAIIRQALQRKAAFPTPELVCSPWSMVSKGGCSQGFRPLLAGQPFSTCAFLAQAPIFTGLFIWGLGQSPLLARLTNPLYPRRQGQPGRRVPQPESVLSTLYTVTLTLAPPPAPSPQNCRSLLFGAPSEVGQPLHLCWSTWALAGVLFHGGRDVDQGHWHLLWCGSLLIPFQQVTEAWIVTSILAHCFHQPLWQLIAEFLNIHSTNIVEVLLVGIRNTELSIQPI